MPRPTPKPTLARVAELLLATQPLAYVEIAPDLTVGAASPGLAPLLGLTEPPLGIPLGELVAPLAASGPLLAELLAGTRPTHQLAGVSVARPDGTLIPVTLHLAPLVAEAPGDGLLLIVVAQATEAPLDRFKDFVLSLLGHDLRAPLTMISGYADMLLDEPTRQIPARAKPLTIIRDQAYEMNRLLNSLLELDRVERGGLTLQLQAWNLRRLLLEELDRVRPLAELRSLTLVIEIPEEPIMVRGDPARLRHMLQSLLHFAIKRTPTAGTLRGTLTLTDQQAWVHVQDSGAPLSEGQRAALFQLYDAGGEEALTRSATTRLALYMLKVLVEAHGGEIKVTSQEGEGSEFAISLPLASPTS